MNKIDTIYQLVKEALAELDQPDHKTSSILRKAIRIATLRNDYENLLWLEWEMIPFDGKVWDNLKKNFSLILIGIRI